MVFTWFYAIPSSHLPGITVLSRSLTIESFFFSEKRRDRWDQAEQNLDVGDRCRKFDHIFRGSPLETLVQQWIYDDLWNLPFGKLT